MDTLDYSVGISMANSDYFILGALRRINGRRCTYAQIVEASELKCSLMTVYRSLDRMEQNKLIKRVSRTKQGIVYQVLKDKAVGNA